MSWEGIGKAVEYTYHCTDCFGVALMYDGKVYAQTYRPGHCPTCEGTGRDPIPWAELFPRRRPT